MYAMEHSQTPIDEDLIAAALAAVYCHIEQDAPDLAPDALTPPAWRTAAAFEAQGLPSARSRSSAWGTVDRAARASRWSYGIVGM